MKALNLNRNSWHHWLAVELGDMHRSETSSDLCSYTRSVLKGLAVFLFLATVVFVFSAGLLFLVGDTIGYWAAAIAMGELPGSPIVPVFMTIVLTLSFLAWWQGDTFQEYLKARKKRRDNAPRKPDGFIANAYKSWKEKTCVRITLNYADADE